MLTTRRKIALARAAQRVVMAGRSLAGRGPQTRAARRGMNWDLDMREGIDFAIWLLGAFEPATAAACARLIPPGGTALDIGANIGAHTLPLARAVGPGGRVYAFEPTDYAAAKLEANLALNPELTRRVEIARIMLMDTPGPVPQGVYASWPLDNAAGAHVLHGGRKMAASGAVAMALDDFLARAGTARVDLIKLDVDGFECRVLRGARRTLARFRPALVLELSPHQLEEQGTSIEELAALLADAGYALETLGAGRALPRAGGALRALIAHGASLNAVARPADRGGR